MFTGLHQLHITKTLCTAVPFYKMKIGSLKMLPGPGHIIRKNKKLRLGYFAAHKAVSLMIIRRIYSPVVLLNKIGSPDMHAYRFGIFNLVQPMAVRRIFRNVK